MTASALKLHPRDEVASVEDRGPIVSAASVARNVCQGLHAARWVGDNMGPAIGFKLGKAWHFYQAEAAQWWNDYIEARRPR